MLRSKDKNLKDPVSFLFILNKRTTNWLNEMQKGIWYYSTLDFKL